MESTTETETKTAKPKKAIKQTTATVQDKAKEAYAKGASALGEVKDFARDNLDAVVESGKILGTGLKDIGSDYVSGGRGALMMFGNDVKGLKEIRSASDLVKYQSGILGRNIEMSMAFGTQQAEAMFKLAKEASAPMSKRLGVVAQTLKAA